MTKEETALAKEKVGEEEKAKEAEEAKDSWTPTRWSPNSRPAYSVNTVAKRTIIAIIAVRSSENRKRIDSRPSRSFPP